MSESFSGYESNSVANILFDHVFHVSLTVLWNSNASSSTVFVSIAVNQI